MHAGFNGKLYYRRKREAVRLKGGRCDMCGERDVNVLHFHHVGKKRFSLGEVFGNPKVSWEEIEAELRATVVLCANDHARLHARQRRVAWERKQKRHA